MQSNEMLSLPLSSVRISLLLFLPMFWSQSKPIQRVYLANDMELHWIQMRVRCVCDICTNKNACRTIGRLLWICILMIVRCWSCGSRCGWLGGMAHLSGCYWCTLLLLDEWRRGWWWRKTNPSVTVNLITRRIAVRINAMTRKHTKERDRRTGLVKPRIQTNVHRVLVRSLMMVGPHTKRSHCFIIQIGFNFRETKLTFVCHVAKSMRSEYFVEPSSTVMSQFSNSAHTY